jgi:quercetin dioxygenase-like cupin family protein
MQQIGGHLMAMTHAQPLEVVSVAPLGADLAEAKTAAVFKTSHVEVIRLVLPQGKELRQHTAPGEIIVQCLEGRIAFTALGKTTELGPGQLLYLSAAEPHSVRAIESSSVLLTILLAKRDTQINQ